MIILMTTGFLGGNSIIPAHAQPNTVIDTISVSDIPIKVAVNELTNRVYVVHATLNTISVVDTTNDANTVIDTIAVGDVNGFDPVQVGIAISENTDRLYVPNSGDDTVSVIDTTNDSNTVIDTISLPVNSQPESIAVNELGDRIYVRNSEVGTVTVIDTTNDLNAILTSITGAGGSDRGEILLNELTARAYVVHESPEAISVIDLNTNTVIDTLPFGGGCPIDIAIHKAANRLYLSGEGLSDIQVIDITNDVNTVIGTITGLEASDIVVNEQTNRLYATDDTFDNNIVSVVGILNDANVVIDTITIPATFSFDRSIALNELTARAYVTNPVDDTVSVIEIESVVPTQVVPDQVTGLSATATGLSTIELVWNTPTDDGGSPITGYQIERESPIGGGFTTIVADTGTTATTFEDTGLTEETQYNYRVSAINAEGPGPASNEAAVTTFTPVEAVNDLTDVIQDLINDETLTGGQGGSLISKLDNIIEKINNGQTNASCNQLNAFINQITAFVNNETLTEEEGQIQIDATQAIKDAAGC